MFSPCEWTMAEGDLFGQAVRSDAAKRQAAELLHVPFAEMNPNYGVISDTAARGE